MNRVRANSCLALCAAPFILITGCPLSDPPVPGETRTFDGIEFQWIPPGTFAMGSPSSDPEHEVDETLHEVTLSEGFWLGKYEVTQDQWSAVKGTDASDASKSELPKRTISWEEVQDFLVLLNLATSGSIYRLPTEAEWEYACRAGTMTRYYWGSAPNEDYGWFDSNSGIMIHPVGEKMPNAWGLYDMSGNVAEFCQDWKATYPAGPVTDPQGPDSGTKRVVRGGSFNAPATIGRSANRSSFAPGSASVSIGFRLVRTED
jgi:formylglycine-generating enzyme required for sulfatase activity